MKINIILLIVALLTGCSNNIDDIVEIKQIESNYPIIIRGALDEGVIYIIRYPLAYKIKKKTLREVTFGIPPSYFWNSSDLIRRKGRRTSNILSYKIKNDTLGRVKNTRKDRRLHFFRSDEYVFYTEHRIDTIPEAQVLFKSYLEKMKRLGKDTLHIGNLQTLSKTNPELTYDFLKGDSIDLSFFYNKIIIDKDLPVEVK